jgi:diacylglycerol kinase
LSRFKNRAFAVRLGYALRGFAAAAASERSLRVQLIAVPVVFAALWWLRAEALWWALVAAGCAAVLSTELMNTALEHLCDVLHPEDSEAIGLIKDCAAAAVLIACLGALAVAVALGLHLFYQFP